MYIKIDNTKKTRIRNYDVYERNGYRGWAIIIMPDEIRIDNYHGFAHVHFSHKGKKHEITVDDMEKVLKIVYNHILENEIIIKTELLDELR